MIESERKKLQDRESGFLSIGITSDGMPRRSVSIPWVTTAHAYAMRIPQIYLSPEDLRDEKIMNMVLSHEVIGCYIWAPLEDYSFLAQFKAIEDINIKNGDVIRDLDFLSELCECRMLFLQNAKLKNLDVILDVKRRSKAVFGCLRCVGLDNCEVEDLSAFEKEKVRFSEFLVWKPEGSNERDRWNLIFASTRRYYEFKE